MPELGQIIGEKYRLEQLLGAGGMGAVYEATHIHIGSKVAIKFLHPGFSENQEAVQRFQREAQSAAAIGHDGIIKVHDLGVTEDQAHFLVLEFLKGRSLGEAIVESGPMTVDMTAYVACQALSGLSAAHHGGIVHRDLKPDNIFLVDTGALLPGVKILDFGISRVTGVAADEAQYTRLTRTGIVLGTPAYMSPEHARGAQDIDSRSDIFSVGIILYETLTGVLPFDGANYNAILAQILTEDAPPITMHRPDLPRGLEDVITKALYKNRDERFQTSKEMFDALVPFVNESAVGRISMPVGSALVPPVESFKPPPVSPTSPTMSGEVEVADTLTAMEAMSRPRARLLPAVLVLVLLLAVAGGAAIGWTSFGGNEPTTQLTPSDTTPTLDDPGLQSSTQAPPGNQANAAGGGESPSGEVSSQKLATVTIEVTGFPEGAKVYLDDALVQDLPLLLAKGSQMRVLKVELDGYGPFRGMVNPTRDHEIAVKMEPLPEPSTKATVTKRRDRGSAPRTRPPRNKPPNNTGSRPYRPAFID